MDDLGKPADFLSFSGLLTPERFHPHVIEVPF
jgi:hypothetical protein